MLKLSSGVRAALILGFAALVAVAATRATPLVASVRRSPAALPGNAPLHAFVGRGGSLRSPVATAKLDATLASLVPHVSALPAEHVLAALHALNPAVRYKLSAVTGEPLVLIDAVTLGDAAQLEQALEHLGLERAAAYGNDVGGWLPLSQLEGAAGLAELQGLRAAMMRRRVGLVTSQGDFAQGSAALRSDHTGIDGSGVTVGVLSDSFDCYAVYEQAGSGVPASGLNGFAPNGFLATAADDESSDDLPGSVTVLEEADCLDYGAPDQLPFTDEGRALLQIVHDVAPGAALAFYTGDQSEADFASGIGKLASAGARVEADDLGYFDEPFFQDGLVAQAIDVAEASGVAYFSAAGNDGTVSYDNAAPSFPVLSGSAPNAGENLLNFDTTGASTTTALSVSVPALFPGEFIGLVLEWDQPYVTGSPGSGGATSALDLCVTGGSASDLVLDLDGNPATCTGLSQIGGDPVQVLIIGNPANASGNSAAESINVSIGLGAGSAAPGRIKLALDGDGAPIVINAGFVPASVPTLQGHPSATGAMAVGAAAFWNTPRCGVSTAVLDPYSSRGGEPILFDTSGARLAAAEFRTKPDLVDADGVNTSFFGITLASQGLSDPSTVSSCANDASYPNFFGTSAATPHAAGAAALFLQYNGAITPTDIYQALRTTAAAMAATVPNDDSGYGFVRVDQALAQLPAPHNTATASGSHGGGGVLDPATLLLLAAVTVVCIARARGRRSLRPPRL